jgi:hypothetical protein
MNEIIDTSGDGYVVIDGTSYHCHDWKKGETVAPDYGKDGYTVYNCPCGESEHRDIVPALFTAAIGSTKYATLADAVAAAKPGAIITLLGNASGAGVVINKNLTIDFRNFTYTFNEGVGSTGTESNGIQILKGTTVILRNGTLKVADEAADKFYILIQNYSDKLTLNNLVLDGRNLDKWSLTDGDSYVLSNNSGKVTVNSQTKFIVNDDGDKAFAFDVCDKSAWGYALPTITVSAAKAIYVDETTLATNYKQYIEATAVISNTYYATLQQAVNMGGTVNLFRDIEGPGVVINKDVNINFGNPGNYVSRGFVSCKKKNVSFVVPGNFPTALLVAELVPGALEGKNWMYIPSTAADCCENLAAVEAFDATFPPKERKWMPSQEEFYIYRHSSVVR